MLMHVCPMPGCGQLTYSGRCDAHPQPRHATSPALEQRKVERRIQDGRNTSKWQRTRRAVLARDNHTCTVQGCGDHATHAHYTPTGHHSRNIDDYQSMCAQCHGAHHGKRQQRRPSGAVVAQTSP